MDGFQKFDSFSFSGPSDDSMNMGLNLGRVHQENGHIFPPIMTRTCDSAATKRSRNLYQNRQNPCCQVEGCNLDLTSAKDYHKRHRICESHSKSPKVIVAGMERRFCQQCSRFHDLSEFDDKKRSCRRRLSHHNARRRRLPPDSIQLTSAGLSSTLYGLRSQNNFLLNRLPFAMSSSRLENASTSSILRPAKSSFVLPSNVRGFEGTPCFTSDEIHSSVSNLQLDSTHQVLDQSFHARSTSSPISPDHPSVHSLLSSNSWSLSQPGSNSSIEQWTYLHPHNVAVPEQGPTDASRMQEFQLFKPTYDTGGFY